MIELVDINRKRFEVHAFSIPIFLSFARRASVSLTLQRLQTFLLPSISQNALPSGRAEPLLGIKQNEEANISYESAACKTEND